MCPKTFVTALICVLLSAFHGSACADEHPWSGAYVSVVSGAVRLEADDERAGEDLETGMPLAEGDRLASGRGGFVEISLRNGERVWLDAGTEVVLQRIFDGPALLLEQGALFVHVPAHAAGDVYVDIVDSAASDARISVRPGGLACIKIGGEFPLVVDLWAGQAAVAAAGNSVSMYPAQRVRLSGAQEFLASDFITEPGTGFEVQSLARLRKIEAAARQDYLESPLQGIDELEGHGRWYYDSEFSGRVWRPYVATGWRPFYNGRWLHHPRGVYWLSHDPWGGVTCHYGNWRYSRRGYWCWVPGYAFTPAAVRFYSSGDYLVWVPAGMHTRFTYGTWWPDDYYRYAVMCRRGSLYKTRGRHCSGGHRGRGGCDDDRFERPKPGSRREVKEVDLRQLPAPQPGGKPDAGPGQKKLRPERPIREKPELPAPQPGGKPDAGPGQKKLRPESPVPEKPETSAGMPERRQGNLQVVPAGERATLPDNGRPPVKAQPRRSVESGAGPGPVFNPQPSMPRSPPPDMSRLPGDIGQKPDMGSPRRSSDRPGRTESPPVFRAPQPGTGSQTNGSATRRQPQTYRSQPRMLPSESGTEPRNSQSSQ